MRFLYNTAQRFTGTRALFRHERRYLSEAPRNKNFFKNFVDNIQDELKRNKELQENKEALQKRLQELNNSEARKKFDQIEKESTESGAALVQKLGELTTQVNRVMASIQSSEAAQEAIRQAKLAAEALEKAAKTVGDTQAYKHVASTAKAVRVKVDNLADVRMYSRPECSDWKIRFDESENPAVRVLRGVTDRVAGIFTEPKMSTTAHSAISQAIFSTEFQLYKDSKWSAGWSRLLKNRFSSRALRRFSSGARSIESGDLGIAALVKLISDKEKLMSETFAQLLAEKNETLAELLAEKDKRIAEKDKRIADAAKISALAENLLN